MARQPEPTISAVLIVKDEEEYLARCLDSVRWVDEIVVYDTGSTDRTVEIAREFTDTVIEGYWNDDFGDARNRALEHATSEWVLQVDADETFDGDVRSLRRHLSQGRANFFTMTITSRVEVPGSVDVPVVSVRLFRRADGVYAGALHEQVVSRSGRAPRVSPLPGAAIRHSGYSEGPEAMEARFRRNLELAEREVADAVASAEHPGRVAVKRANLARSLSAAGRAQEALELAEQIYRDGDLAVGGMELLAQAMTLTAAGRTNDFALARTWVDRLRRIAANRVWADAMLVEVAVKEGAAARALDALECVPSTVVDALGRRLRRVDLARFEVWALWELGRAVEAQLVAESAARAGVLAGDPTELWTWLGADGVRAVVALLPEGVRQVLAVLCTQSPSIEGRRVLEVMAQAVPGDPAILLCASRLSFSEDLAGLEEAATWSVRLRTAGLAEHCPLVAAATDEAVPPAQRARAAALALFAYDDPRALPALESALASVAPEDEAELAAQLEVLAPGLVSRA